MSGYPHNLWLLSIRLTAIVKAVLDEAVSQGKALKPYDGAISMWCRPLVQNEARRDTYTVRLSCSVLGDGGTHYSWHGETWGEAFGYAFDDIAAWREEMAKPTKRKRARKKKGEAVPAASPVPQVPLAKVYDIAARRQAEVRS